MDGEDIFGVRGLTRICDPTQQNQVLVGKSLFELKVPCER